MTRAARPAAILVAAMAAAGVLAAAGEQVQFRARRDTVRVDILVTDHGQFVKDLHSSDLQVRENGVVQDIESMGLEEMSVNAVMALDVSGSMSGDRLDQLRGAGRALVGALKKDDRAALVTFSHAVDLVAPLTLDLPAVRASLDDIRAGGGTALQDASYAGLLLGQSDAARGLLVVFSDGVDTASWLTADAVIDTAKRSSIVVYGVSVRPPGAAVRVGRAPESPEGLAVAVANAEERYGAPVGRPRPVFLQDLAAFSGGAVFEIESTKDLGRTFLDVLEEFHHRYLVSYSPKGGLTSGWHKIEIEVKTRRGLNVKARPGYQAG